MARLGVKSIVLLLQSAEETLLSRRQQGDLDGCYHMLNDAAAAIAFLRDLRLPTRDLIPSFPAEAPSFPSVVSPALTRSDILFKPSRVDIDIDDSKEAQGHHRTMHKSYQKLEQPIHDAASRFFSFLSRNGYTLSDQLADKVSEASKCHIAYSGSEKGFPEYSPRSGHRSRVREALGFIVFLPGALPGEADLLMAFGFSGVSTLMYSAIAARDIAEIVSQGQPKLRISKFRAPKIDYPAPSLGVLMDNIQAESLLEVSP